MGIDQHATRRAGEYRWLLSAPSAWPVVDPAIVCVMLSKRVPAGVSLGETAYDPHVRKVRNFEELRGESMKALSGLIVAVAATCVLGSDVAEARPSSVQREDGPCYPGYEQDSADGAMYCSGLDGVWTRKSLRDGPKRSVGTPCSKLGDRARALENHGIVECQSTPHGLRWRNIR